MRKPSGALWSHRDFLKLWTGQTVSEFGSQISQLAIPTVAVLTLKASPFQVAALETVVFLPFLLFTLPAGVWVDRWRRRRRPDAWRNLRQDGRHCRLWQDRPRGREARGRIRL